MQRLGTRRGRAAVRAGDGRLVRGDRRAGASSGIVSNPEILKALSPTYALAFLFGHFGTAFFSLAAVVLAVTGAEALYADMGHFGRGPITRAWLFLVFPACILNYLGQGALVLSDPTSAIANPFFLLVPGWARIPMVILATAATVIASQAVISGAFSVTQQAAQLGYLPRLRIAHTSEERVGQIYVPVDQLGAVRRGARAGLHVPHLDRARLRVRHGGHRHDHDHHAAVLLHRPQPVEEAAVARRCPAPPCCSTVDLLFFAANLTKLPHGAWLPLPSASLVFTVLTTWQKGRQIVTRQRERDEGSLREFIDELHAQEAAAAPGAGHRGLPQPGQGDRAAGHARQRRAQPRAARARRHPGHRDAPGPARRRRRPARDRRPRLRRRPDHPRHRPLRLHGHARRPLAAAAHPRGRAGRRCSTPAAVSYFLSTIEMRRGQHARA